MISPISSLTVSSKVQAVRAVARKPHPDEEDQPKRGQGRPPAKKTQAARAPISTVSASAEARSSIAVQAALTDLRRGG
jgi:hypothetical protein